MKIKDRLTVIFLHGNSSSAKIFEDVMESPILKMEKIAISFSGHDQIDFVEKKKHSLLEQYCQEVLDVTDNISHDVVLVGNSMGGYVALEVAERINNLKGLVIMGTAPISGPQDMEKAFLPSESLTIFLKPESTEEEVKQAIESAVYNKKTIPFHTKSYFQTDPRVRTSMGIELRQGQMRNQFEIYTTLPIKKMIIHGAIDPTLSIEYLKEVDKIAGEKSRLSILEKCGHYPSIDAPLDFINELNSFLSE